MFLGCNRIRLGLASLISLAYAGVALRRLALSVEPRPTLRPGLRLYARLRLRLARCTATACRGATYRGYVPTWPVAYLTVSRYTRLRSYSQLVVQSWARLAVVTGSGRHRPARGEVSSWLDPGLN
eukprot:51770-Rhodomonas_salina.1